jgi:hypothetical protein
MSTTNEPNIEKLGPRIFECIMKFGYIDDDDVDYIQDVINIRPVIKHLISVCTNLEAPTEVKYYYAISPIIKEFFNVEHGIDLFVSCIAQIINEGLPPKVVGREVCVNNIQHCR